MGQTMGSKHIVLSNPKHKEGNDITLEQAQLNIA